MNYSILSSLLSEDITFIACRFVTTSDVDLYKNAKSLTDPLLVPGYRNQTMYKTYVYKTILKGLKVGDLVAVESTGSDKPFGCYIVQVVCLDAEADYSSDIVYKWAFQKVDIDALAVLKQAEADLATQVRTLEKQAKRNSLLAALKEQGILIESLNLKLLTDKTIEPPTATPKHSYTATPDDDCPF